MSKYCKFHTDRWYAIISRPTLNALRAVISTYHMVMKFPVENLVGEVRGDQAESWQCYIMSTTVAEKHKVVNTIFHLEDVEVPPTPNNISHTLGELDPREKEKEKRGSPIEEPESIRVDEQYPEDRGSLEASGTSLSASSKNTKTYSPDLIKTCLRLIHRSLSTCSMSTRP